MSIKDFQNALAQQKDTKVVKEQKLKKSHELKEVESKQGTKALLIQKEIEKMLINNNKKKSEGRGERYGLHASAIIQPDSKFCFREQLLSLFYRQNQGSELSSKMIGIFNEGNAIHEKWQNQFKMAGKAVEIEVTNWNDEFDISFTPDIIAQFDLDEDEYVVEIKSMNTFSYQKQRTHPSGSKQCNFYIWLKYIKDGKKRKGIVLMEDKNTQDFKVQIVNFDKEAIKPIKSRLVTLQEMKQEFIEYKTVPPRTCKNCNTKRALECNMRDACFNIGIGRQRLKLNKGKTNK